MLSRHAPSSPDSAFLSGPAVGDKTHHLRVKTVRGAFWTLIDTGGGQALSFAVFLFLARLLSPRDYGIVSLAGAMLAIPGVILNEGFGSALIQWDDLRDEHVTTAVWANAALALLFMAPIFVLAPLLAKIAQEPLVAPALMFLSVSLLTTAFTSIAEAIYRRRIQYATFALRTFVATVSGAIVGIIMAVRGDGVWALVGSQIAQNITGAVVIFWGLGWRPRLTFSASALRDLVHFASRTMIANALRFATEKTDAIIVGGFLGTGLLGFYYLAQRLLSFIISITMSPVLGLMLPTLSRMQGDRRKLADTYTSMTWALALLWVPTVGGVGVIAVHAVPLLFGSKWIGAIPLIQIVCVTALTQSLTQPTGQALYAVGKPGVTAALNGLQFGMMVVSFLIGVQFGIKGAAWAFTITSAAIIPFHLMALRRYVEVHVAKLMREYASIVVAGLFMVGAAFVTGNALSSRFGDWSFLAQSAVGAATYVAALISLAPRRVGELLSIVRGAFLSRARAGMTPAPDETS